MADPDLSKQNWAAFQRQAQRDQPYQRRQNDNRQHRYGNIEAALGKACAPAFVSKHARVLVQRTGWRIQFDRIGDILEVAHVF